MLLGSVVIFCFHVAAEGCLGPAPSCPHPNPTSPAAANWHPRHHLWMERLVEFAEWSDLLLTPRKCPAGQPGSRLGRAWLSRSLSSQSTVAFVRIPARGGFGLPVAEARGRVQAESKPDPGSTHSQLWHFFIGQHKVSKRAWFCIAHRHVTWY